MIKAVSPHKTFGYTTYVLRNPLGFITAGARKANVSDETPHWPDADTYSYSASHVQYATIGAHKLGYSPSFEARKLGNQSPLVAVLGVCLRGSGTSRLSCERC